MKFSWGSRITLVYVAFVAFLVAAVLFAFRQNLNMVTDNYYEKELFYQTQIDKEKRTAELPEKPEFKLTNSVLYIKFPKSYNYKSLSGTIHLYRPSDEKKDITIPIEVDTSKTQAVGLTSMQKGLWKIKMNWNYQREDYFSEYNIMVQ